MARFVILEHDHPFQHWDLMLEAGDVLRTWRLRELPLPGMCVVAERSFDHRPFYLDYEGPISGNRGNVVRRDAGHYQIESESESEIIFRVDGERWRGNACLRKDRQGNWLFQLDNAAAEPVMTVPDQTVQ
jgi:DNA polymerase Ligase (LigD)